MPWLNPFNLTPLLNESYLRKGKTCVHLVACKDVTNDPSVVRHRLPGHRSTIEYLRRPGLASWRLLHHGLDVRSNPSSIFGPLHSSPSSDEDLMPAFPRSSVRTRTLDHTTPKVSPCPLSTSSTGFFAFLSPFRTATSTSRVLACLPAPLPNLRASLALEPFVSDFRHVRPFPSSPLLLDDRREETPPSCLRSS